MNPVQSPHDRLLYLDERFQVGRFEIHVSDREFTNTGPIQNHILVFPARPVEIAYSRQKRVVADLHRVMCYNRGCEYNRRSLNPQGDLSWWIAYDDHRLAEVAGGTPDKPFTIQSAPSPRDVFVVARSLVAEFESDNRPDPVWVEESAWWLLDQCLKARRPAGMHCTRRQRRAVRRARAFMAEHYCDCLRLDRIAAAAGMSSYHLSRAFHRVTGMRLWYYLLGLRLRAAVQEILDGTASLTEIAANLGFSSSSHFSTAFKKEFGVAPNRLRSDRRALEQADEIINVTL